MAKQLRHSYPLSDWLGVSSSFLLTSILGGNWWHKTLGPSYQCGRPGLSFWFPALACPNSFCGKHLENGPVDRRSFCHFVPDSQMNNKKLTSTLLFRKVWKVQKVRKQKLNLYMTIRFCNSSFQSFLNLYIFLNLVSIVDI